MNGVLRVLVAQAVILVATLSLPWVVLAPVPGLLKVTAPVLCPDAQPDAHVVEYDGEGAGGTGSSTNVTLICMGPDGDITEVGSWRPLGLYLALWWVVLQVLALPFLVAGARRRRRGPTGPRGPREVRLGRIRVGVGGGGG